MARHRLKGPIFRRESGSLQPKRAIILAVEGQVTEVQYFEGLNEAIVNGRTRFPNDVVIHVLRCTDTRSDPGSVIDLLEEHIERSSVYSDVLLNRYEAQDDDEVAATREYPHDDVLGIVIDHDHRTDLRDHIEHCRAKRYDVFLTTPCFELWLLCHYEDVAEKYSQEELYSNERVSKQHNFVSRKVSEVSHSNKRVDFERKMLPNLYDAIERSKKLATDIYELLHKPGTNMALLFEIIEGTRRSMWDDVKVNA